MVEKQKSAQQIFEEMLDKIGLENALALQLSVAQKFQDSVRNMREVSLLPQECAFLSIWIDALSEVGMRGLGIEIVEIDTNEVDPTEVGRPGGFRFSGYL